MPLKVVRRKDTGTLQISGTLKYPDGSVEHIRRRAASDDLRLAREEASALEAKLLRDAWHGERRGSRTFAEAVISYFNTAPRAPGTKRRVNRILHALGGDLPLRRITQETVDELRAAVLRTDASQSTVRRTIVTPLRAVLRHANRRGWCDAPAFEIPKEPQGRTKFFLPAEAQRLIAAAAPHLKPLLLFLLGTGARMSEAAAAADKLAAMGLSTTLADARFAKPLDEELILRYSRETRSKRLAAGRPCLRRRACRAAADFCRE